MKASYTRVFALIVVVVGALAGASALTADEEAAIDRRLRQEFGMRKFDPERDYGPGGFLGTVTEQTDSKGRRLLLPVAFGGLLGGIQTGVKVFQTIVSFFGKTYTEQLIASHLDNGYSEFRVNSEAQTITGLSHSRLVGFLNLLGKKFGMQGKEKELFVENNRWAAYTLGGKDWHDERYVFSVGKGGNARTASVFINNDIKTQKMNVLFINSKTEFKLAPDVFVILCSTTQFWSTSHKIKFKKTPANIKQKDIEFVSNYGNMISIQLLADMAGLKVPKDPNFKKYERDLLPDPDATSVRFAGKGVLAWGGSDDDDDTPGWGEFGELMQTYNTQSREFDDVGADTAKVAAPNGNPFRKPEFQSRDADEGGSPSDRGNYGFGEGLSGLLSRKSLYRLGQHLRNRDDDEDDEDDEDEENMDNGLW